MFCCDFGVLCDCIAPGHATARTVEEHGANRWRDWVQCCGSHTGYILHVPVKEIFISQVGSIDQREDFHQYVSESTDVSAEVVDAKTSVEESPVAVQRTAQCWECGDAAFRRFGFLIEWMMSPSAGEACLAVKSER